MYDNDAPAAFTTTTTAQVAKGVVGVLKGPAETVNRRVFLSYFTITLPDLHAALERVTGEKWKTSQDSRYELEKEAKEDLAKGQPQSSLKAIQVKLFRQGFGANFGLRKNDNKLLEREEEDLDTVVRQVLA